MGEKGEGSGGKGGGNWEWGTPCPPPHLRILGAKENTLRELRNFLSGIRGDQCIIVRGQGSTDPLGASQIITKAYQVTKFNQIILIYKISMSDLFTQPKRPGVCIMSNILIA